MTDETAPATAMGSPVIVTIRNQVPEFEEVFRQELDVEGPEMGAFQAISVFADWLEDRIQRSPESPDVRRAFRVVEEVASGSFPMGGPLVTEFVEALRDNPRAVSLMGPETLRVGR